MGSDSDVSAELRWDLPCRQQQWGEGEEEET
jgi:hypothetical protein